MSLPIPTSIPIPRSIPIIKTYIPIWLYKWLALMPFIGFVGLDHWAINSKFTGLAKLFINLFTFGSWYAYDIVQAWNGIRADKQLLQSGGLDIPFFEGFNIGKGSFDNEPLSNMSKNTQLWLLLLFIGTFGLIYYFCTFFLTSESGFLNTFIYLLSNISFYGFFLLITYTIFFYLTSKTNPLIPTIVTPSQAKQSLYSQYGFSNPLVSRQPKSTVSSVLSFVKPSFVAPRMFGGSMQEDGDLKDIAETLKVLESTSQTKDHIYFLSLLLVLPISGFIAYTFSQKKELVKKDEISR